MAPASSIPIHIQVWILLKPGLMKKIVETSPAERSLFLKKRSTAAKEGSAVCCVSAAAWPCSSQFTVTGHSTGE